MDYLPKPEILDKHKHYADDYRPGDLYWGIGIEREFYLESSAGREVTRDWILCNQKPERYSVRYFNSYKPDKFNNAIQNLLDPQEKIILPVLFNAHALCRCDANGQHETTYEKIPKPNPKHNGKVLFEYLLHHENPFFKNNLGKSFYFDGDSIELVTQNYYCTSIQKCCAELRWLCKKWIHDANEIFKQEGILQEHLPLRWAEHNHGLANMWTNPGNVSIFNNGTYHINLTAPTQLNAQGLIANRKDFVHRHQKIARIFQWLEPFFISFYGTGDVLALGKNNYNFARGSLRVAMSRYVGCGTFDTNMMENGKKNTIVANNIPVTSDYGWYKNYHQHSNYNSLEEIGLDINFNKHYNHGIELRIFDWFPEERLEELLEILVCAMDQALSMKIVKDPRVSKIWNKLMARSVSEGVRFCVWESELRELRDGLGLPGLRGFKSAEVWKSICSSLFAWKKKGQCYSLMSEKPRSKSCLSCL